MPPAMPSEHRAGDEAEHLVGGVLIPTVAALSSSSRMAIRPMPNFVRRIRHDSSSGHGRAAPTSA